MNKTFDKKDIFCSFNVEDAQKYIGKLGYFGNTLKELKKWVDNYPPDKLGKILEDDSATRIFKVDDPEPFVFSLFLPADKVKEVEELKKYRAFKTIEEFIKTIGDIGTIITYHTKKDLEQEMRGMFTGYMWDRAVRGWLIGIGADLYRLENLFELVEYKYKNEWKPFGLELKNES